MKKIFIALALVALNFTGFSQSPKMVFVEEGTQASCGPCASQNPGFDDLLNANTDKAIVLKYQTSWPGFDQMNLDNPTEVAARVSYYGFNGVPTGFVNGQIIANDCGAYDGAPTCLSQDEIDEEYLDVADFDIVMTASIENGTLFVDGNILANTEVAGDLKLRVVLAEANIAYVDVPGGSNGETEFHHVMKKFLTGTAGETLPSSWGMGDSQAFTETLNLSTISVYDFSELEVIAFIQNDDNKNVHQAALVTNIPISVDFNVNGSAISVNGLPNSVCSGSNTISPVFLLGNGGNDDLTSADIVYSIDGGAEQTYAWTGNISTLGHDEVMLDPITFDATVGSPSILSISVTNINGGTDEDMTDNVVEQSIELSNSSTNMVQVHVVCDQYADETYWEIRNSGGDVIAHGGNPNVGTNNIGTGTFPPPASSESYSNNSNNTVDVNLESDDCYTFHITDFYGDGILGAGYYEVKDSNGDVIISEDNLIDEEINTFEGFYTVGVNEIDRNSSFSVYPNPTSDNFVIQFDLNSSSEVKVEITNLLGEVSTLIELGHKESGNYTQHINVKDMPSGIYLVTVLTESSRSTKRITINK